MVPEVNPADARAHSRGDREPELLDDPDGRGARAAAPASRRSGASSSRPTRRHRAPARRRWTSSTSRAATSSRAASSRRSSFAHRIAFNCIPQIDVFLEDGSTKEEWKMVVETREDHARARDGRGRHMRARARAPLPLGGRVNVEFASPVSVEQARTALGRGAAASSCSTTRPRRRTRCPRCSRARTTPTSAACAATTSVENGLTFWVVADQLRKGAALNAVQIAELLLP